MEKPALNILVVEDDKIDFTAVSRLLEETQEWHTVVDWAKTYEEGAEQISQRMHDVYLIDYMLGSKTGLDLLNHAKDQGIDMPIIVLTGHGSESVEQSLNAIGASDYLEKGELTTQTLERSIRYALRDYNTTSKLKSHEDELVQIKQKLDQLTEINAQNQLPPVTQVIHTNRIPVGTRIANYEIDRLVGKGGMGTVYVGKHVRLDRKVALKFLIDEAVEDEEVGKRFEREALAISAINHPNIVSIFDVDQWQGTPYIAMEYVEGVSLSELFAEEQPLPVDIVVNFLNQLARGLLQIHNASIVHRDIKPNNIIIDYNGYLKVLDFGLAKLMDASRITRSEHTLGTAHYVAPEMYMGTEVDFRADIWSAGVLVYQMLTGKKPFGEKNLHRVMYAVLNKDPEPLSAYDASIPEALQQIVDKCLAKNPEDRYPSFELMIDELVDIARTMKGGTEVLLDSHAASFIDATRTNQKAAEKTEQKTGQKTD